MSRTIAQFMWGYQPHFRIAVEVAIEQALKEIGFPDKPAVLLVGFQVGGEHQFPICIEPEQGPFQPADLAGVARRADELYELHPDRDTHYSDPRLHEGRHAALRNRMRAKAISEALGNTAAGRELTFFASGSARVGDYDVHIAVGLNARLLDRVPQLQARSRYRIDVVSSLVHAVVQQVLTRARRALYLPDATGDFEGESPEIARVAGSDFMCSVILCAGHFLGYTVCADLNALSTLPYEGRPSSGQLAFAKAGHSAIDVRLALGYTPRLRDTQAVRKLLEASGNGVPLLSNGEDIYGYGRLLEGYDPSTESVFVVDVQPGGKWQVAHNGQLLMAVQYGAPRLPISPLDVEYLEDVIDRVLPNADKKKLVELALAAGAHQHGAMLVISSDASGEAARLAPQAWVVDPVIMEHDFMRQLTSMDGGLLVDGDGCCHAVGVILDGVACGGENPVRGSRFNNAVRYLASETPPAVIVVYSADGAIDILPKLRPRVRRSTVQQAVTDYVTLATPGNPGHGFSEARDRVKDLAFYMTHEQCDQVNAARAAMDQWAEAHSEIRIVEDDLAPDPDMNDSYWLAE